MREAREEMLQSLNESNFEKMRKASKGAKQTLKMKDGSIGMDSFTASAIMQIYDKVNDKNKKTMENLLKNGKKADIVKLMKFAMSKVNAEYVPEDMTVTASTDGGISQRDLDYVQKQLRKLGIRDAVVDQNEMDSNKIDVKTRMSDDKVKRAFDKSKIAVNYEHVKLDEINLEMVKKELKEFSKNRNFVTGNLKN